MNVAEVAQAVEAARAALRARQGMKKTAATRQAPTRLQRRVVTPTHEPCGASAVGELCDSTLDLVCVGTPVFLRCGCGGLHAAHRKKRRKHQDCARCGGSGWIVAGMEPGCGEVFENCPFCGLRRTKGGRCATHSPAL